MKPAPFAYRAALSTQEALGALAENDAPRLLAGGQSLVPMLNLRIAPADSLLDITRIPELRAVAETPAAISYGAAITHAAFEDGLVADGSNGLMRHVASQIAYRAVRNRGTIGGALALADPAADWVTTTIALEAVLHLRSHLGTRKVAAHEFILGPYFTALDEDEFIAAVEVPRRSATERWGHRKVVVKTGEYAKSMAIALIDRPRCTARLVLGATDGTPIVLERVASAILSGARDDTLKAVIRDELLGAARDFPADKLIMHTTSVLRAVKDASAS